MMKNRWNAMTGRRRFLGQLLGHGVGIHALARRSAFALGEATEPRPLRFGMIADLHHGLAPTALTRLEAFVAAANARELDFVIQLGDFCFGDSASAPCMDVWRRLTAPTWHVLGNHDMDRVSKPAVMDYWGMTDPFYSFDCHGRHIVVLDCNHLRLDGGYEDYDTANFYRYPQARAYVSPEQLEWLEGDLKTTQLPTLLFSHQGLADEGGARNRDAVREVVAREHRRCGFRKVVMGFCGHHHIDRLSSMGDVPHLYVNSASYHWVGADYGRMADYTEPLFAFVSMESNGALQLEGRLGTFEAPTPTDRGYPRAGEVTASIEDRTLQLPTPRLR